MSQYTEGQKLKGSDGNVYVVQNGVPVLAAPAASGPVYGAPPKAPDALDVARYNLSAGEAQRNADRDAARDAFDVGRFNYDAQRNAAKDAQDAEAKALDIQLKQRELAKPTEAQTKLEARKSGLGLFEAGLADLERRFQSDFAGTNPLEYLPTPGNRTFDDAGRALMGHIATAFGLSAQQQNTPAEMEMRFGPFIPKASDSDEQIRAKLQRLREMADSQRREIFGTADTPDGAQLVPGEVPVPQSKPAVDPAAESVGNQIATSEYKTVEDPALRGVRGEYLRRLEAGQSGTQLVSFLRSAGVNDPQILRSAAEQARFRRANPNVPISRYNVSQLGVMDVPLSDSERIMGAAAKSAPGAYVLGAAGALTGNTLDNIVGATGGNAERARIAMADAARESPIANIAGQVSGGVLGALTAEAGLARAGMASGLGRSLLADTGYGAISGAGAGDDGNRVQNALLGGATGLGGSLLGQYGAKALGSAISPTGGNAARLYESGVRPTLGQRLVGAGDGRGVKGLVGRAVNNTEEALSSVPIVGSAIRGARQEARDQWQVGAFNEALKDIGYQLPKAMKPGADPHIFTQRAFDHVYDKARSRMVLRQDDELMTDLGDISRGVGGLTEASQRQFARIVEDVIVRRGGGDVIRGDAYKKIQSELGKRIRGLRSNKTGDDELAAALEDVSAALDSAARRHSPAKAVRLMENADRGYAKYVRIQEAAAARGGDAGTFTPTQFDRSIQRNARGKRSSEYLRGEALMQDYADAGMNLVDRLPNSGTFDRLAVGAGAAGLGYWVDPMTAAGLGAVGAAYAPGIRKATVGAMAPRGPKAQALADKVRRRSRLAGAIGAQLLPQTSVGP